MNESDVCTQIREFLVNEEISFDDASTATGVEKRSIIEVSRGNYTGFTLFELRKMLEGIEGIIYE